MTDDATRVTTPRRRASSRTSRGGGAAHWIYLVYLANLGWQLFFDPGTGVFDLVVVAVVVVTFVPLWALARTHDRRRIRIIAMAMIALGILGTLFNVGASVLFVYAAAVAGSLGDEEALRIHVGITLIIVALMAFSPIELPYRIWGVLPALAFVCVIGLESRRGAANVAEAERLRIDNVRIEALATAAERDRIARDLHDLLGQSLTGLVVRA
jgi:two-component system, NarL family, sensor histidine kinase DesK